MNPYHDPVRVLLLAALVSGSAHAAPLEFSGLPWLTPAATVTNRLVAAGYVRTSNRFDSGHWMAFHGITLGRASLVQVNFDRQDRLNRVTVCYDVDVMTPAQRAQEHERLKAYYTRRYGPAGTVPGLEQDMKVGPVPQSLGSPFWPRGAGTGYRGNSLYVGYMGGDNSCGLVIDYQYGGVP